MAAKTHWNHFWTWFWRAHDHTAYRRQRVLSFYVLTFLLVVTTIALLNIWAGSYKIYASRAPIIYLSMTGGASIFALLMVCITFMPLQSLGTLTGQDPAEERESALALKVSVLMFYFGVGLSLVTFASVVVLTRGLVESPFTSTLFALILAGQSLSRFRPQSNTYVCAGILLTGIILLADRFVHVKQMARPDLYFTTLATSFLMSVLITLFNKGPNPRTVQKDLLPDRAEIYQSNTGCWFYTLYSGRLRIDNKIVPVTRAQRLNSSRKEIVQDVLQQFYPRGIVVEEYDKGENMTLVVVGVKNAG